MTGQFRDRPAPIVGGPSTEERLLAFLHEVLPPDTPPITGETPLFRTGLLDSLAIVHLIVWVEEQTGRPLDPRNFDPLEEWSVVSDVSRFVDRVRSAGR